MCAYGCSVRQAARDGILDAVRMNLINSKTRVNDVNEDGYAPLHYAARYNRLDVVEILVKAGAGLYCRPIYSLFGHT